MDLSQAKRTANNTRYIKGQTQGHYESYFLRANHPSRPLAFWIRYTIFSPDKQPEKAIGELWFIFFDGEKKQHSAAKSEVTFSSCSFSNNGLSVKIEDAILEPGKLKGAISNEKQQISWDLSYRGSEEPLFDLPVKYYDMGFPKAKVLVGIPLASYRGSLKINGETIAVDNWIGSENHNWGTQHTDHYAWGQVAGFVNSPESFLELATARIKIGPIWSPFMTPIVFRHRGREFSLNELQTTLRRASFTYFDWTFKASSPGIRMEGNIHAEREDFVCLPYNNPIGGVKFCLNSKIASCRLEVWIDGSKDPELLETSSRAAFEILTDKDDHGLVPAL
jgi:hypothetical protein